MNEPNEKPLEIETGETLFGFPVVKVSVFGSPMTAAKVGERIYASPQSLKSLSLLLDDNDP